MLWLVSTTVISRCSLSPRKLEMMFDVLFAVISSVSNAACLLISVFALVCRLFSVANRSGASALRLTDTLPSLSRSLTSCVVYVVPGDASALSCLR